MNQKILVALTDLDVSKPFTIRIKKAGLSSRLRKTSKFDKTRRCPEGYQLITLTGKKGLLSSIRESVFRFMNNEGKGSWFQVLSDNTLVAKHKTKEDYYLFVSNILLDTKPDVVKYLSDGTLVTEEIWHSIKAEFMPDGDKGEKPPYNIYKMDDVVDVIQK